MTFSWYTDWCQYGHEVTIPFDSATTVTLAFTQTPSTVVSKLYYSAIKNGSIITGYVTYGSSVTLTNITQFIIEEVDWSSATSTGQGTAIAILTIS